MVRKKHNPFADLHMLWDWYPAQKLIKKQMEEEYGKIVQTSFMYLKPDGVNLVEDMNFISLNITKWNKVKIDPRDEEEKAQIIKQLEKLLKRAKAVKVM